MTTPETKPPTPAQLRWTLRVARDCGLPTVTRTLRYLRATAHLKPPTAHTLEFIGVHPNARGTGAARLLLNTIHPTRPLFLTTADPRNVSLYHHCGFETTTQLRIDGLTVTAMIRPPR
ncbi:GNAT family N-acetyltransferase [Nocardia sp. CDC159]|uniref:GNAT family N-acetyltransferase n=1 Tax=Nocardia pulmonis TaxID=2951408 RepID=A0A9X2E5K2_9NOCA|nr:GNAT family N-acetyltransferase [Nocardia pulmonis]MCM6786938.1 GNAT family N-acetyltransferase [Nocardia sp. CDC159]